MKRFLFAIAFLLSMVVCGYAQVNSQRVIFTASNPPTACVPGKVYTNTSLNPAKEWVGTSTGACTPAITSGTVTSIATTSPITGGTITTTGTIACATCVTSAASLTLNQLVFGGGSQAAAVGDLTGDVTTSGGKATTIANNAVTLAKLATQATNTVLGNATSGTAVPTALAVGTCSTAGSALIWTTNTGFGCNTSITAAAVPVGGITGLGTGVATALAVNVGSAGAPVLFNGALGTPSSGTVTNLTGTASININGTVGATTPTTAAVTTLGASGTITSTIATSGVMLATGTSTAAKNIHLGTTGGDFYFGIQDNPATFFGQALANESVLYSFTQPLTIVHGANNAAATTKFSATNVTHGGTLTVSGITTDATHTDSSVCQDTTTHQFYAGSGAAGICLGTSSLRFKRDITSLGIGLAEINALQPVSFNYLNGYGDSGARRQVGFLAEDVYKVMPSLVGLDKDGKPQSVDYMGIMIVQTSALKELNAKVERYHREETTIRNRSVRRRARAK